VKQPATAGRSSLKLTNFATEPFFLRPRLDIQINTGGVLIVCQTKATKLDAIFLNVVITNIRQLARMIKTTMIKHIDFR